MLKIEANWRSSFTLLPWTSSNLVILILRENSAILSEANPSENKLGIQSLWVREERSNLLFLQKLMTIIISSSNLKAVKVILRLQFRHAQGAQWQVLVYPYIQFKNQILSTVSEMWSNENKILLRTQLLSMSKTQQDSLTCTTKYFQGNILFSILTQESALAVFLYLERVLH